MCVCVCERERDREIERMCAFLKYPYIFIYTPSPYTLHILIEISYSLLFSATKNLMTELFDLHYFELSQKKYF